MQTRVSIFCLLAVMGAVLVSCGPSKQPEQKSKSANPDTAQFYTILPFIEEQSRFVDLRNFLITREIDRSGSLSKDTISKDIFQQELKPFKKVAEAWETERRFFTESVFQDLGTESFTLTYSPLPGHHTTILRLDVLLRAETNSLKKLFIRSEENQGGNIITRQFSFTADKKFEIVTEYPEAGQTKREIRQISWTNHP